MGISSGKKIVLASGSPRRRQLVKEIFEEQFTVEFINPDTPETLPGQTPIEKAALVLARMKMEAVKKRFVFDNETILITADTLVIADNKILGKPSGKEEALEFLLQLSGTWHTVTSAFCVSCGAHTACHQDTTRVKFMSLAPEDLLFYINRHQPFDKAGGYGIQEWIGYIGIESIEGSFYTVMGLPTHLLYRTVKKIIQTNL